MIIKPHTLCLIVRHPGIDFMPEDVRWIGRCVTTTGWPVHIWESSDWYYPTDGPPPPAVVCGLCLRPLAPPAPPVVGVPAQNPDVVDDMAATEPA